ncbi:MAG: MalY/PatB family protein [Clostridia bacterium]
MLSKFDEIINRKNTDSLKHDFALQRGKPEDILPLWVADMDFKTPQAIIAALVDKSQHGIFGYSESSREYFKVLQNWFANYFDWEIKPAWLVKTPSVVFAICAALRALTVQGDAVLIQEPVYYPFAESILLNQRKLVVNQLLYQDGKYHIDFADFETKIRENSVKLFILCSPHNPVGRVWTKIELLRLGEICLKYNVLVIADEIHADFVYQGYRHLVFANLRMEFSQQTITCTAPTKTFNLAGLQISNIFIENKTLRHKVQEEIAKSGYSQLNIMGMTACKAAYTNGREWLLELNEYLAKNIAFVQSFLIARVPKVKLVEPEGTYLVWLDFQELGLSKLQLEELIIHQAGLWLDAGEMFGAGGAGFQRINIACPLAVLEKALLQLEKAINQL